MAAVWFMSPVSDDCIRAPWKNYSQTEVGMLDQWFAFHFFIFRNHCFFNSYLLSSTTENFAKQTNKKTPIHCDFVLSYCFHCEGYKGFFKTKTSVIVHVQRLQQLLKSAPNSSSSSFRRSALGTLGSHLASRDCLGGKEEIVTEPAGGGPNMHAQYILVSKRASVLATCQIQSCCFHHKLVLKQM